MNAPGAVVFDFDGVLADTEGLHLRAFQDVFSRRGWTLDEAAYFERYLGFDDRDLVRALSDHRGDTFRAVYTVRLGKVVYVLHAFQKKSTAGIATPRRELNLVKARLKLAEDLHRKLEKG